uniref:Uncharacterized protein LOC111126454 isoform X2 n=1 Tax=Crassostrea virginica TaxID=6565 RepID=A0A8B8DFX1_CRAVI|nr:uncharacterized protein LOC111126454 isoform X2 [Crassostrea virginica]
MKTLSNKQENSKMDLSCRWKIGPSPGRSFVFSLMISEVPCYFGDYVKLFKDNETDALNNNEECGKDMSFGPMTLTSSSTLVVEFVSKSSRFMAKSKQGFRLLFLSASDMSANGCQERQILLASDTPQYISSPNFPDLYQSNMDCEWEIEAPTGYDVNILVLFLDIENEDLCTFDFLRFNEGSSSNTNSLCVENNFQFGNIRGSNFVVSFQSDDSQNKHGFLLRYKSTAASSKDCSQSKADIVFLLDSSGSVGEDNFVFLTSFIGDLISDFNIGPEFVQVGLVTYQTNVTNRFDLNRYGTKEEVLNATKQVPYSGGWTNTDLGLNHTLWHSFAEDHGARPFTTQLLLVFTDGVSNHPSSTRQVADDVKGSGVTIISVGVESGVDSPELFAIASREEYVFRATSFTDLETIKYSLENIICKIISSVGSNPQTTTTSYHPPTLQFPVMSPGNSIVMAPLPTSTETLTPTADGTDTSSAMTSTDISSSLVNTSTYTSDTVSTDPETSVSSSGLPTTDGQTTPTTTRQSPSTSDNHTGVTSKSNQTAIIPEINDILEGFVQSRDIIAIISVCTVFVFLSLVSCCILLGLCVVRQRQKRRVARKEKECGGPHGDSQCSVPIVHARAQNIHVHYHASTVK